MHKLLLDEGKLRPKLLAADEKFTPDRPKRQPHRPSPYKTKAPGLNMNQGLANFIVRNEREKPNACYSRNPFALR